MKADQETGTVVVGVRGKFYIKETRKAGKNGQDEAKTVGINVEIKDGVLKCLKADPELSAKELGAVLNTTSRTIERQLKLLREEGVIRRMGSKKTGRWEILESS